MRTKRLVVTLGIVVFLISVIAGCGKSVDEEKPLDEVKAEAEKMDKDELRKMAVNYKDKIVEKQGEIKKIEEKIKDIAPEELMGDEAKELKKEISEITKSVKALKDRYEIYFKELKKKKGDLTDLDL